MTSIQHVHIHSESEGGSLVLNGSALASMTVEQLVRLRSQL